MHKKNLLSGAVARAIALAMSVVMLSAPAAAYAQDAGSPAGIESTVGEETAEEVSAADNTDVTEGTAADAVDTTAVDQDASEEGENSDQADAEQNGFYTFGSGGKLVTTTEDNSDEIRFKLEDGIYKLERGGTAVYWDLEQDYVIDLNGNTLTFSYATGIYVHGNTLTIKDSNGGGKIVRALDSQYSQYSSVAFISVGEGEKPGTVILESGAIEATDGASGIYAEHNSNVYVKGGAITSTLEALGTNNTKGNGNFYISGGTLTTTDGPCIYKPSMGSLFIGKDACEAADPALVSADSDTMEPVLNGGVSVRQGTVKISGGTINGVAGSANVDNLANEYKGQNVHLSDALYVLGGAYNPSEGDDNSLSIHITGGTFNCNRADGSALAIYDLGHIKQNMTVQIEGGNFIVPEAAGGAVTEQNSGRSSIEVLALKDIMTEDELSTAKSEGYGQNLDAAVSITISEGTFSKLDKESLEGSKIQISGEADCQKWNDSNNVVIQKEHSKVTEAAVQAKPGTPGHMEYEKCSNCGTSYIDGKEATEAEINELTTYYLSAKIEGASADGDVTAKLTENEYGRKKSAVLTITKKEGYTITGVQGNGIAATPNEDGTYTISADPKAESLTDSEVTITVEPPKSEEKPEEPDTKPEEPDTKPEEPDTKPDTPTEKPDPTPVNPSPGVTPGGSVPTAPSDSNAGTTAPVVTVEPDGTKVVTETTTKPDGTAVVTETKTKTDGTVTETVKETKTNTAGKAVAVATVKEKDASGKVTGEKVTAIIANAAADTSAKVEVVKDGTGTLVEAKAEVTKAAVETAEGKTKGTISSAVVKQIVEAAGTTDVTIAQTVTKEDGSKKFTVQVNAKDLESGNALTIMKLDPKTGEYVFCNAKEYAVSASGGVSLSIKTEGDFILVSEAQAEAASKAVLSTVKVKESSKSVKAGKSAKVTMSSSLNMKNVSKITYKVSNKSVATVNKNGKVTTKKAGKVTVTATVTLKNGKTKMVKMTINVK